MNFTAVIFDLGGVVISSPMQAFANAEREQGLATNFINHMIVGNGHDSAWGKLERGEIAMNDEFFSQFDEELTAAGAPGLSSKAVFTEVATSGAVFHNMINAIVKLREEGYKLAALTNNWVDDDAPDPITEIKPLFDVVVESAVEGVRKPDPRIYQIALERLGVEAQQAIFLDDIGQNLKSARALGLTTIKVVNPDDAIVELEGLLGLSL